MNIFVCVKQVPDTETRIRILPSGQGIDESGIKWVVNPYDEYAIEEAIKLKESQGGSPKVVVVTVGPKSRSVDALRTALAMGADEGIVVDAPEALDSYLTAMALAAAIKAEGEYKLVLTGKLAIDDNGAAVSQFLAEFLGIPHATVVSKFQWDTDGVTVERETEGGAREVIKLGTPCLVAANKGLNSPRYASLPGIMKAKKKPVKELTLEGLGIGSASAKVKYSHFQLPADKPPVKMLAGDAGQQAKELARLLMDEAKVF